MGLPRRSDASLAGVWAAAYQPVYSTNVIAGNSVFTLLGYMGLYLVLGILFLFLIQREIGQGRR